MEKNALLNSMPDGSPGGEQEHPGTPRVSYFDLPSRVCEAKKELLGRISPIARTAVAGAANLLQGFIDPLHCMSGESTYEQYKDMASKDELTHVYSRRGLFEAVEKCSMESGSNEYYGVFFDLCDLKAMNDSATVQCGDNALKVLAWGAKRLFELEPQKNTDIKSLVGRWGGDEFIALMPRGQSINNNTKANIDLIHKTISVRKEDGIYTENVATWNIRKYLENVESTTSLNPLSDVPDEVRLAISRLNNLGIDQLRFRWNINELTVCDDGIVEIVKFMDTNGSKYIRKPTARVV